MSGAFTPPNPPDLFSKDDIRTMADVRRNVWVNGIRGLVLGSLSGYGLHTIARLGAQHQWWKKNIVNIPPQQFTANTAFVSFMLGGALGSYIMAVTAGKNSVHRLHGIFENGTTKPPVKEDNNNKDDLSTAP